MRGIASFVVVEGDARSIWGAGETVLSYDFPRRTGEKKTPGEGASLHPGGEEQMAICWPLNGPS